MDEELDTRNEDPTATIEMLRLRNTELSTLVQQLRAAIDEIKGAEKISAEKHKSGGAKTAEARVLAATLHDLRQPLQSLSLLHDAFEHHAKDEKIAPLVNHFSQALLAVTKVLDGMRAGGRQYARYEWL